MGEQPIFSKKQLRQFGSVTCSIVQTNELWYPKLHPQFHEAITDVFRCNRPQRKRSWPSSFAVTTDKTILVFRLTVRKQGTQYVAKPMVKALLISFYRSSIGFTLGKSLAFLADSEAGYPHVEAEKGNQSLTYHNSL